jgi:hypothetical protein
MKEFGSSQATFLSGNGPLVAVLREALARDFSQRLKTRRLKSRPILGKKRYQSSGGPIGEIVEQVVQIPRSELDAIRRKEIDRQVRTLIESVHVFAKYYWEDKPHEVPNNVAIVFDEAQRAWNEERNAKKFERPISEPEMLLSIMERHRGAVIVALVGGGQEINDGEAGLSEWGRALQKHTSWQIVASPIVFTEGHDERFKLANDKNVFGGRVISDPALHLNVATRSLSAERICEWVDAVLGGDVEHARRVASSLENRPKITRDLASARVWLRGACDGLERSGLVGSANAKRLRADGLEPSYEFHSNYKWPLWFLNSAEDVRSSSRLEVFATQFEIQGLELDWVGVCWSDDFTWSGERWVTQDFDYYRWNKNSDESQNKYRLNGHRVLLTRARKGMVIVVPSPDPLDSTRLHSELEKTASFLCSCGAELI